MKYIALLALVKIVPTHRDLVAKYQDMILSSVGDQDLSIRMRALDLLSAMVGWVYYLFLNLKHCSCVSILGHPR